MVWLQVSLWHSFAGFAIESADAVDPRSWGFNSRILKCAEAHYSMDFAGIPMRPDGCRVQGLGF